MIAFGPARRVPARTASYRGFYAHLTPTMIFCARCQSLLWRRPAATGCRTWGARQRPEPARRLHIARHGAGCGGPKGADATPPGGLAGHGAVRVHRRPGRCDRYQQDRCTEGFRTPASTAARNLLFRNSRNPVHGRPTASVGAGHGLGTVYRRPWTSGRVALQMRHGGQEGGRHRAFV